VEKQKKGKGEPEKSFKDLTVEKYIKRTLITFKPKGRVRADVEPLCSMFRNTATRGQAQVKKEEKEKKSQYQNV